MKAKSNTTTILRNANYSFDPARDTWFCGKKTVDEEDVQIYLIRYAKSENIENAGEYAEYGVRKAKNTPEITTSAFMKTRMVRNRNRRIAGKYLFEKWCIMVKIEIIGGLEDFMRRNSLLVNRFYNEIAAGYECCKRQARIAGRVMRSVFIGWELRDEEADEEDAKAKRQPQKAVKADLKVKNEGMIRHLEFMSKLFGSDP